MRAGRNLESAFYWYLRYKFAFKLSEEGFPNYTVQASTQIWFSCFGAAPPTPKTTFLKSLRGFCCVLLFLNCQLVKSFLVCEWRNWIAQKLNNIEEVSLINVKSHCSREALSDGECPGRASLLSLPPSVRWSSLEGCNSQDGLKVMQPVYSWTSLRILRKVEPWGKVPVSRDSWFRI